MAYVERRKNDFRARWKRPDGSYDGLGGFLDEEEALAHGRDQETDIRRGDYYDRRDGALLFKHWATEWLEAVDVDESSEITYHSRIRSQLLPTWGEVTLAAISESPLKIKAWQKRLRASGLSASYVGDVVLVFRLMLEDAVKEKLIKSCPIAPPSRRRGKYVPREPRREIYPSAPQAIELAENGRLVWRHGYAFMMTKAFTGMRLGEMIGLRREYCHPLWPACEPDPEARTAAIGRYGDMPAIRVEWQLPRASRGLLTKPPKYGSRRTLVVPPFLAELLCDVLDSHDSEWVFPAMKGASLWRSRFYEDYWDPIVDGSPARVRRRPFRAEIVPVEGMAGLVPHGLRHGHKTWLDEDGFHSRVAIEARMGHVIDGVEGVYSHVTPEMERSIAAALQVRWARSMALVHGQEWVSPGILLDDLREARKRGESAADLRFDTRRRFG